MFKKSICIIAAMFCSISAFAKPAEVCTNFANYAYSVVNARNSNVDRLQLKDQTKLVIESGKTKAFTMLDYIELSRIVDILYAHPEVTPEYAAKSYFDYCLADNSVEV